MRKISEIRLKGLIFHILDHHTQTGLFLSEAPISIQGRQSLTDYISKHIIKSLGDESTKAALFIPPSETEINEIEQISQALISNSTDLLNGSQQIAKRLYESINGDTRISSGVLAVSLFQELENNDQTYLALLKLDRTNVFRPLTRNLQGKKIVDFETIPNALPTTGERLQKCAFVRSPSTESEYDLMILDLQTREPEAVAHFFAKKFLGIEFAFDSRTCTLELYKALTESQNKLRSQLTAEQNLSFSQAKDYAMKLEVIDVNHFVSTLAIPEPAKNTLLKTIQEFSLDLKFKIDPEIGRKISRKKRFKGEHGFSLEVNTSDYEQVVESIEPDDNSPYSKIVLRVKNLEEK